MTSNRVCIPLTGKQQSDIKMMSDRLSISQASVIRMAVSLGLESIKFNPVNPAVDTEPELDLTAMTDEQRMDLLFGAQA